MLSNGSGIIGCAALLELAHGGSAFVGSFRVVFFASLACGTVVLGKELAIAHDDVVVDAKVVDVELCVLGLFFAAAMVTLNEIGAVFLPAPVCIGLLLGRGWLGRGLCRQVLQLCVELLDLLAACGGRIPIVVHNFSGVEARTPAHFFRLPPRTAQAD